MPFGLPIDHLMLGGEDLLAQLVDGLAALRLFLALGAAIEFDQRVAQNLGVLDQIVPDDALDLAALRRAHLRVGVRRRGGEAERERKAEDAGATGRREGAR